MAQTGITDLIAAIGAGAVLAGGVYGLLLLTRRLLRLLPAGPSLRLPTGPVPNTWPLILEQQVPLTGELSEPERARLLRLVQMFLHEVPIEGCSGLQVTEEMQVTIAATACLLIVNFPYPRFTALRRVLIYPDTFVPVHLPSRHTRGVETEPEPTLGEAWRDGIVVLSWSSVRRGDADASGGRNVVLHEFAHVLDGEDGAFDGSPILESPSSVRDWRQVFEAAFGLEHDAVRESTEPPLEPYAATNRAEFFAVATEVFFEAPVRLRQRLPELYEQLRLFYRQDPAARSRSPSAP